MKWRRGLRAGPYEDPQLRLVPFWPLSDGEIHYFYWFIQGSIMNAGVRWALRRAWGLCERHAWAALAVETAFRSDYVLGPTVLYVDLLDRCLSHIPRSGPFQSLRFRQRMLATGPCMACDMGLYRATSGLAKPELLDQGRQTDALVSYARRYRELWQPSACQLCAGSPRTNDLSADNTLCRPHILAQRNAPTESQIRSLQALLKTTYDHVSILDRSYTLGNEGTERPEGHAALLTAIGWLSGWRPLLALA